MMTVLMMILLGVVAALVIAAAVAAARDESRGARWRRAWGGGRRQRSEAAAVAARLTDADRRYLADSWQRVAGLFVADPAVAVDVAHKTVQSVFEARGLDTAGLPEEPDDLTRESTEELRLHLLRYERLVGELTGAVPIA